MLPIHSVSSIRGRIQAWASLSVTTTQCSQSLSDELNGVKKTYTEEVLNFMSEMATEHLEEVDKLKRHRHDFFRL